jgi:hypothetical protein
MKDYQEQDLEKTLNIILQDFKDRKGKYPKLSFATEESFLFLEENNLIIIKKQELKNKEKDLTARQARGIAGALEFAIARSIGKITLKNNLDLDIPVYRRTDFYPFFQKENKLINHLLKQIKYPIILTAPSFLRKYAYQDIYSLTYYKNPKIIF